MISHALARNITVPFFMALFLLHRYGSIDLSKIYCFFTWTAKIVLPVYIVFIIYGFKPVSWFISPTWTTNHSILQYLLYIPLTNAVLCRKTKDNAMSFTMAFISATSAGYLYEIPFWVKRDGLIGIIRTAKTSFIGFDFGMMAFIYFIFLLSWYNLKTDKRLLAGVSLYLLYIVAYTLFYPYWFIQIYRYTLIPPAALIRAPSLVAVYVAATNLTP